jgi:imidazoleglycerol-phosphate dehydratase
MLELFAKHSLTNLELKASGDLEVDMHHTVEDIGICLGKAIDKALGLRIGIRRYGFFLLPMDEALAEVSLDLGGRPYFVYSVKLATPKSKTGDFDIELLEEFFQALSTHGRMNLHMNLRTGSNLHHIAEALFKAFARAFDDAKSLDKRVKDVPSTKGTL